MQETEEEKSKDQEVKEFFASIAGEDLEVDCYELQQILDFALKKGENGHAYFITSVTHSVARKTVTSVYFISITSVVISSQILSIRSAFNAP